ncbi:MAG TPA: hypothetical protein VOB72_04375 [Candidatus Dormibacteraeota bacterium]|nr:hypothetical protein [Candidatus Dormibacteraeota bacterium]
MSQFGSPAGLRALAGALTTAAADVSTSASSLGGQVSVATAGRWTGGAATAFQAHWDGEQTQMLDLGLSATVVARVLNDLATALERANQLAAQAQLAGALSATPGGSGVQLLQQAMQVAQQAWTQATTQLAGVTVPAIGPTTTPQQAQAWAAVVLSSTPLMTDILLTTGSNGSNDPWWKNRRPPFPPLSPAMDPALNGWQDDQTQTVPIPMPFPGGGILANSITVRGRSGSGKDALAALLAASAAAAALFGSTPQGRQAANDAIGRVTTLFSKKPDLQQVRAAGRQAGVRDLDAFGKWLEGEKQYDPGTKNERGDYTWQELLEKAQQYLDEGGR